LLETTVNPFATHPAWKAMAALSPAERYRRIAGDADLRRTLWRTRAADGSLVACFNFPLRIVGGENGKPFAVEQESEDWHFSRKLHELGARTLLTRRVRLYHGSKDCRNDRPWGRYENGDEDTASRWRTPAGKT
jgi:hypothetical protein